MKGTETMNKKPEVGQWWVNVVGDPPRVHKTGIVLFVGRDSKKRLLWEDCQGHIETDYGIDWSGWHHEPACTGWDWVPEVKPEQKWPQWYVPRNPNEVCESFKKPIGYYRRDSAKKGETFYTDGESFKWGYWEEDLKNELVPCSQADAEARVTNKPVPTDVVNDVGVAESPDDWVTQDRAPARKSIDQYRYIWRSGKASAWDSYDWLDVKHHVHGYTDDVGDRMEVRCRRKDLPVVEAEKTASVTVYEVVYGDRVEALLHDQVVGHSDLEALRENWKYVSVVSTKTVEVML